VLGLNIKIIQPIKIYLRYFPPTIFTIKLKSLLKISVIPVFRVHLNTINSITDVSELLHCMDEDWQRIGET
jgi:hypothetical protein